EPSPPLRGGSTDPDPDGFCVLEAPETAEPAAPRVRWLAPGPLRVLPGHFGVPRGERDRLRAPPGLPPPRARLILRDLSLTWALFGGRDFGPGPAQHRPRLRSAGPAPPRWRSRGGPGRVPE
ncbi:ATG2A protein, partial [Locustella ochotensis]|nr:ATG2A protein [Locustella ochotensis]